MPRTTLQYWVERKASLEGDRTCVTFFESPAGVAFLHRLMVALLLVFTFVSSSGLRRALLFLELAGLAPFVAASFGSLQRLSTAMEAQIRAFAAQQRESLAKGMPEKRITVCQDETFHPAPCLVAMEPVSDFLLLEAYAEGRDKDTWDALMAKALEGLKVQVVQCTSDEAKALRAHAQQTLGAHHSPDLFHIQQELSRASAVGLARQVRTTEEQLEAATGTVEKQRQAAQEWATSTHGPGRPPDFATHIAIAEARQKEAQQRHNVACTRQETARTAIRGIGEAYHPVNLETGKRASAAQVEAQLKRHMDAVENVVQEAQLPERCTKGVAKAKRLLGEMTDTVRFFEKQVASRLDAMPLSSEVRRLMEDEAIPAAYLAAAAPKAQKADAQDALAQKAGTLLSVTQTSPHWLALGEDVRDKLRRVAVECAEVFQRASSCVEGRNGQLSLRHHSLHRLRPTRLEALTAVHNYFIKRTDGTTAAERFFGAKHANMFEHLLLHTRLPPRPIRKRSIPPPPTTPLH